MHRTLRPPHRHASLHSHTRKCGQSDVCRRAYGSSHATRDASGNILRLSLGLLLLEFLFRGGRHGGVGLGYQFIGRQLSVANRDEEACSLFVAGGNPVAFADTCGVICRDALGKVGRWIPGNLPMIISMDFKNSFP